MKQVISEIKLNLSKDCHLIKYTLNKHDQKPFRKQIKHFEATQTLLKTFNLIFLKHLIGTKQALIN